MFRGLSYSFIKNVRYYAESVKEDVVKQTPTPPRESLTPSKSVDKKTELLQEFPHTLSKDFLEQAAALHKYSSAY